MSLSGLKPSTRSLLQSVSPNPHTQNQMRLVESSFCAAPDLIVPLLQKWEDEEISALIIKIMTQQAGLQDALQKMKATLQCPFVAWQTVTKPDDLLNLRGLNFDAVLTQTSHVVTQVWQEWQTLAQTMNMPLIYEVTSRADWEVIKPLKPRFIFVEKNYEFLQEVPQKETWWIGPNTFEDPARLKCRLTEDKL